VGFNPLPNIAFKRKPITARAPMCTGTARISTGVPRRGSVGVGGNFRGWPSRHLPTNPDRGQQHGIVNFVAAHSTRANAQLSGHFGSKIQFTSPARPGDLPLWKLHQPERGLMESWGTAPFPRHSETVFDSRPSRGNTAFYRVIWQTDWNLGFILAGSMWKNLPPRTSCQWGWRATIDARLYS